MATRIKSGEVPYTWWIWIEITNNHVINVLLRELNNLIHVNENREIYVDLQLDDWIEPDSDFPVWVTTWKILQEDWREQSWTILNWKTTSWDYIRFIYANDGKLYYDPWTWEWIEFALKEDIERILENMNVKMFEIDSTSETTVWQEVVDWYLEWKYPILYYNGNSYIIWQDPWNNTINFYGTFITRNHSSSQGQSRASRSVITATWNNENEFTWWITDVHQIVPKYLSTEWDYAWYYTPIQPWHPATKKYVDDWLATKQTVLTPWTRITIDANNVISADISWVLTYKWNVTDPTSLPSWATVWDCYFSESDNLMYAWDWTQWNQVWSTSPDLSNFFDKVTDDSDDIIEGSTHLFVTSSEKSIWNNKQDTLIAWNNITIDWDTISATDTDTTYTQWDWIEITAQNVINNTAKFEPDNAGAMGQYLKKTNDGYAWANIPWWGGTTYTAWDWIDITNNVISNTNRFNPTNTATIWYVLKASGVNSYYRAPESWWGWGWGGSVSNTPYGPDWDWVTNVAPSKNAIYDKIESMNADTQVKVWQMHDSELFTQEELQEICVRCLSSNHSAIIKRKDSSSPVNLYVYGNKYTWLDWHIHFVFFWMWESTKTTQSANWDYTTRYNWKFEIISWDTITLDFSDSYNVSWNYISVTPSDYSTPFLPTFDYQPATKWYVDSRNRVGTLSEYNAIITKDPDVIYNITSLS